MKKLVLIDGNSIANRAFYALPPLTNSAGLHTNAVYGFTTMLMKILNEQQPTHFLIAFDAGKVTFRHAEYKEYKGGRAKTPPELSEQFPLIRELVQAFGISQKELSGYEADDIIGTLTRLADERGFEVLVVTGDKDMLQLASENVTIAVTRKGISEVELYNPAHIHEVYGLIPDQIKDLKGLMGDTSDNIPGIPGVGEKTALKFLHQYGSVEGVLAHVDEIAGKMQEKVREHAEAARMSKALATIDREVPLELHLDELAYSGYDSGVLAAMFRKLEFKSLLDKLDFTDGGAAAGAEPIAQEALDFAAVGQASELAWLEERLDAVRALHVEAIGDNPHEAEVAGVAFYLEGGIARYVPLEWIQAASAAKVRGWLGDAAKPKVVFDAHRAAIAMGWKGVPLRGATFCVNLAAYLLNPTESEHSLSALARRYELSPVQEDDVVFGKGAKFKLPELDVLTEHMCRKASAVYALKSILTAELENTDMHQLYRELEFPLVAVLTQMEQTGIKVNRDVLYKLGEELSERLETIVHTIYDLAGGTFNIGSPKQLGEVLFDKLGLPVWKKTKTGYSTDAEVLEWLRTKHPIVEHILTYRQLSKLQSTYVEGLLKEVRPETGHIHTYYQQTIAATGRLSSQFPNLQNIPIRLEEGRQIRKAFLPAEQDWHIVAADYSQIELRVLAHISQDPNLIEAFHQGMDIHTKTAMDVFGVSEAQVDANMRRSAKAVNFGIVYGISDYGLSQNLDISRAEAAKFIEQYFAVFQGVRRYMEQIVEQARHTGYVTTLLNRRRYLPDITSSNFNIRSFAERMAMNSPIQGSAADIIKLAMVQMADRLRTEGLHSRMLLQVHDELVFEVPTDELETMKRLVPAVMESAMRLAVPLKADLSYGNNWYEAK